MHRPATWSCLPTQVASLRDDTPAPVINLPANPTPAQLQQIERVPGAVFTVVESIAGLDGLVGQALCRFPNAGPAFNERLSSAFSELDMFRQYANLSSGGASTAQFKTAANKTAGFVVRSRI